MHHDGGGGPFGAAGGRGAGCGRRAVNAPRSGRSAPPLRATAACGLWKVIRVFPSRLASRSARPETAQRPATAGALVPQSAIKGDAEGYQDEFELQYRHYKSQLELLRLSPQSASRELANLVQFLAQVAHCYPSKMAGFPKVTVMGSSVRSAASHPGPRARQPPRGCPRTVTWFRLAADPTRPTRLFPVTAGAHVAFGRAACAVGRPAPQGHGAGAHLAEEQGPRRPRGRPPAPLPALPRSRQGSPVRRRAAGDRAGLPESGRSCCSCRFIARRRSSSLRPGSTSTGTSCRISRRRTASTATSASTGPSRTSCIRCWRTTTRQPQRSPWRCSWSSIDGACGGTRAPSTSSRQASAAAAGSDGVGCYQAPRALPTPAFLAAP